MISISVLTSTMNRADYLDRVYLSLLNQNFDDFEWIIGDDGSTDSTMKILKKLKKIAPFDIKILSASVRVGKTTIDNKMIKLKGNILFFATQMIGLSLLLLINFMNLLKNFQMKIL